MGVDPGGKGVDYCNSGIDVGLGGWPNGERSLAGVVTFRKCKFSGDIYE